MTRYLTDHTLEVLRGPNGAATQYQLQFATSHDATEVATITGGFIPAGRCCSLNSAGKAKLGVGDGDLAMFSFYNSDERVVATDGGSLSSEAGAYSQATPTGVNKYLVATGGFELQTTEFKTALTYVPQDKLTAPVGTPGDGAQMLATAGVLTNASVKPYSHNVVGVVSQGNAAGATKNAHGYPVLAFWSVFLPKIAGIAQPTWV